MCMVIKMEIIYRNNIFVIHLFFSLISLYTVKMQECQENSIINALQKPFSITQGSFFSLLKNLINIGKNKLRTLQGWSFNVELWSDFNEFEPRKLLISRHKCVVRISWKIVSAAGVSEIINGIFHFSNNSLRGKVSRGNHAISLRRVFVKIFSAAEFLSCSRIFWRLITKQFYFNLKNISY